MDYKTFYTTVAEQMNMNDLLPFKEKTDNFSIFSYNYRISFFIMKIEDSCYMQAEICRYNNPDFKNRIFRIHHEGKTFSSFNCNPEVIANWSKITRSACGNRYFYEGNSLVDAVLRGRDAQELWDNPMMTR